MRGGWEDTMQLDIFSDGTVETSIISHSTNDIRESSQAILSINEQDSRTQLFSNFSQYDPEYSAKNITDGDYHRIVYTYEG